MKEEAHQEAHIGAIGGLSASKAQEVEEVEWEEWSLRKESERESVGLEVEASLDVDQSRWLAALQSLGVVEEGVIATAVCTRGEYARALMASTTLLTRYPTPTLHTPSGESHMTFFPPSLFFLFPPSIFAATRVRECSPPCSWRASPNKHSMTFHPHTHTLKQFKVRGVALGGKGCFLDGKIHGYIHTISFCSGCCEAGLIPSRLPGANGRPEGDALFHANR